jgi:hypothetical protein
LGNSAWMGRLKVLQAYTDPMHMWTATAATGISQRLNDVPDCEEVTCVWGVAMVFSLFVLAGFYRKRPFAARDRRQVMLSFRYKNGVFCVLPNVVLSSRAHAVVRDLGMRRRLMVVFMRRRVGPAKEQTHGICIVLSV